MLDDATAWFESDSWDPDGDHVLVVAEVVEAGLQNDAETLTLKETGSIRC